MDKYLFYAETIEGYSFKVLIQILEKKNKTVSLKINKNGIFICMIDEQNNIIIDSSFYVKFMKKNIFSEEYDSEEYLFGLSISNLNVIKGLKKHDILIIACEKDSQVVMVETSNPDKIKRISTLIHKKIVQNYKIELPKGYCDFPINLNRASDFTKVWREIISSGIYKVIIQLKRNTLKITCDTSDISSSKTTSITLGENDDTDEVLYEEVFKTKNISNIIKISSVSSFSPRVIEVVLEELMSDVSHVIFNVFLFN